MLFKINFKIFDFDGLINSVNELVNNHNMKNIKFFPKQHEDLFDEFQLTHLGDLNNKKGFMWAWKKVQDRVRQVSFNLFTVDKSKQIIMSIDLDDKSILLNKTKGISSVEVEVIFKNNMVFTKELSLEKNKKVNKKLKKESFLYKFFWGFIILILVGLIVNYFLFKFGWN